jgi:methionyl-tRNA formyltransferase
MTELGQQDVGRTVKYSLNRITNEGVLDLHNGLYPSEKGQYPLFEIICKDDTTLALEDVEWSFVDN